MGAFVTQRTSGERPHGWFGTWQSGTGEMRCSGALTGGCPAGFFCATYWSL